MIKQKHHEPIVYAVYDYLKGFVGEANAIKGRDLATHFNISERKLRSVVNTIRNSTELTRIILSSNKGYFMATEEEFERANRRLENQAHSLLKASYANRKKASKDGQFKIPLGEYYSNVFEAFGEQF